MRGLTTSVALSLLGLLIACSDEESSGSPDATVTFAPQDVGGGGTDGSLAGDMVGDTAGDATAGPEADVSGEDVADAGEDAADAKPGFEYPCEPGALESCITECGSFGMKQCLKDWSPCFPSDEFCGNCVDDDCDGLVNENCPPLPECDDEPPPECPIAAIEVIASAGVGTTVTLSSASSSSLNGAITGWQWSVVAPAGSTSTFQPSATAASPTFLLDVAGDYFFSLAVTDAIGEPSCLDAQAAVTSTPDPPQEPEVGCADGAREGFVDQQTYTHIAGCSGAWDQPGVTPDAVTATCGRQGGDDGSKADGGGCSAVDLCAAGWHVCDGWWDVAASSPNGCAGAVPAGAAPKSLFFAVRQPSENNSVCGDWGDGFNDVFGCGNLGNGLDGGKNCGPLDRVLASTQADRCGFNEAEPPLGPWQCIGGPGSDLGESKNVTKKGCPGGSCSYDGQPVNNADKGGVLCCRDAP